MFKWWRKLGAGGMERSRFQYKMCDVRNDVGRLLTEASVSTQPRIAGMARKMLKVEDAFWTFVDHDGVEPTNNFGERVIRGAVMWRKLCLGTDSCKGSRFVERIMTAATTLRLQGRPVLEYLTEAYLSRLRGEDAPALVPVNFRKVQRAV